jgi:hypothetical protein
MNVQNISDIIRTLQQHIYDNEIEYNDQLHLDKFNCFLYNLVDVKSGGGGENTKTNNYYNIYQVINESYEIIKSHKTNDNFEQFEQLLNVMKEYLPDYITEFLNKSYIILSVYKNHPDDENIKKIITELNKIDTKDVENSLTKEFKEYIERIDITTNPNIRDILKKMFFIFNQYVDKKGEIQYIQEKKHESAATEAEAKAETKAETKETKALALAIAEQAKAPPAEGSEAAPAAATIAPAAATIAPAAAEGSEAATIAPAAAEGSEAAPADAAKRQADALAKRQAILQAAEARLQAAEARLQAQIEAAEAEARARAAAEALAAQRQAEALAAQTAAEAKPEAQPEAAEQQAAPAAATIAPAAAPAAATIAPAAATIAATERAAATKEAAARAAEAEAQTHSEDDKEANTEQGPTEAEGSEGEDYASAKGSESGSESEAESGSEVEAPAAEVKEGPQQGPQQGATEAEAAAKDDKEQTQGEAAAEEKEAEAEVAEEQQGSDPVAPANQAAEAVKSFFLGHNQPILAAQTQAEAKAERQSAATKDDKEQTQGEAAEAEAAIAKAEAEAEARAKAEAEAKARAAVEAEARAAVEAEARAKAEAEAKPTPGPPATEAKAKPTPGPPATEAKAKPRQGAPAPAEAKPRQGAPAEAKAQGAKAQGAKEAKANPQQGADVTIAKAEFEKNIENLKKIKNFYFLDEEDKKKTDEIVLLLNNKKEILKSIMPHNNAGRILSINDEYNKFTKKIKQKYNQKIFVSFLLENLVLIKINKIDEFKDISNSRDIDFNKYLTKEASDIYNQKKILETIMNNSFLYDLFKPLFEKKISEATSRSEAKPRSDATLEKPPFFPPGMDVEYNPLFAKKISDASRSEENDVNIEQAPAEQQALAKALAKAAKAENSTPRSEATLEKQTIYFPPGMDDGEVYNSLFAKKISEASRSEDKAKDVNIAPAEEPAPAEQQAKELAKAAEPAPTEQQALAKALAKAAEAENPTPRSTLETQTFLPPGMNDGEVYNSLFAKKILEATSRKEQMTNTLGMDDGEGSLFSYNTNNNNTQNEKLSENINQRVETLKKGLKNEENLKNFKETLIFLNSNLLLLNPIKIKDFINYKNQYYKNNPNPNIKARKKEELGYILYDEDGYFNKEIFDKFNILYNKTNINDSDIKTIFSKDIEDIKKIYIYSIIFCIRKIYDKNKREELLNNLNYIFDEKIKKGNIKNIIISNNKTFKTVYDKIIKNDIYKSNKDNEKYYYNLLFYLKILSNNQRDISEQPPEKPTNNDVTFKDNKMNKNIKIDGKNKINQINKAQAQEQEQRLEKAQEDIKKAQALTAQAQTTPAQAQTTPAPAKRQKPAPAETQQQPQPQPQRQPPPPPQTQVDAEKMKEEEKKITTALAKSIAKSISNKVKDDELKDFFKKIGFNDITTINEILLILNSADEDEKKINDIFNLIGNVIHKYINIFIRLKNSNEYNKYSNIKDWLVIIEQTFNKYDSKFTSLYMQA